MKNFSTLDSFIKHFNSEEKCSQYLADLRWSSTPVCPHCGSSSKIYLFKDRITYKCGVCGKKFTVKVGTILEDSKLSLQKWFIALYLVTNMKKGVSSTQLSMILGITQKTAWFMLQRIQSVASISDEDLLSGVVQVDETYVGGKESNKHANKKTLLDDKVKGEKVPVLGMIEAEGQLKLQSYEKTDKKNILNKVNEIKNKKSTSHEKPVKINMNFQDFVKKLIKIKKK